jgi:thioredoxin reductase (NADPH)
MNQIEANSEVFPILTENQIESVRAYGREIKVSAGSLLYSRGDRNTDFFVVLDGAIDAIETHGSGKRDVFHTHRHGSFLGELNLFNSRKTLVSTQASEDSRLICVKRLDFRRMLTAEIEIAKIILQASVLRRTAFIRLGLAGTSLIGDPQNPDTLRIRRFLTANDYPHQFYTPDAKNEKGQLILDILSLKESDLPAVWDTKERLWRNPCLTDLAFELGLLEEPTNGQVYDLVVTGAGPAGLAAAVYAGSEGLDTLVVESWAPGGQAGTSSQIENYLGFPNGISGWELAARAQVQAQKFGVQIAVARAVTKVERESENTFRIFTGEKSSVCAKSIVVASGATYRKLDIPEYDRFEGRGIQYAATSMEAQLCAGQEVAVVGGGNSAGQAALFLSQTVARVHLLVRDKTLSSSMSNYLLERIKASSRIQVHYETQVTRLFGEQSLEKLEWKNTSNGETGEKPIRTLFVMIGAIPNTGWLRGCVELDDRGFIVTGQSSKVSPFQTSIPGIFAIGDVRSGSVKRVASAVGEGSIVVSWVHHYLAGP